MKRSEINSAVACAQRCFETNHWALPPHPQWDVTDFGLGEFPKMGAVLVNLALEPEYSEKVIYMTHRQLIINHAHKKKKEDIICRVGAFSIRLWFGQPGKWKPTGRVQVNNELRTVKSGDVIHLRAGERITLTPGLYHEFWALSDECIIGEVSTANDDQHDNFFVRQDVGRFTKVEEDEAPLVRLCSDK